MEKVERRLASCKKLYLSKGGKVTLIKSILLNIHKAWIQDTHYGKTEHIIKLSYVSLANYTYLIFFDK